MTTPSTSRSAALRDPANWSATRRTPAQQVAAAQATLTVTMVNTADDVASMDTAQAEAMLKAAQALTDALTAELANRH